PLRVGERDQRGEPPSSGSEVRFHALLCALVSGTCFLACTSTVTQIPFPCAPLRVGEWDGTTTTNSGGTTVVMFPCAPLRVGEWDTLKDYLDKLAAFAFPCAPLRVGEWDRKNAAYYPIQPDQSFRFHALLCALVSGTTKTVGTLDPCRNW